VLPGWEGSAHDAHVLESAPENGFLVPEGKYYLADAGYPSVKILLNSVSRCSLSFERICTLENR